MRHRKLGLLSGLALIAVAVVGSASASSSTSKIQVIKDPQLQALYATIGGGALPQSTTRTIQNWWGSTTNGHDGITYGYNMAGGDPNNCSGGACDATIQADITPINVTVGGLTFSGQSILNGVLGSPQFATNDYGSTTGATIPTCTYNNGTAIVSGSFCGGPGGALSPGDAGNQLQLEDATMRAQFNQTGSSSYHLRLNPHVMPAVTINVPSNQGTLLESGRGVVFASVDIGWWSAQVKNLETKADPTHLPIYLTDDVMLFLGKDPTNCCVIGYHGTIPVGLGAGSGNSRGLARLQTFAWASWVQPGIYARPDHGTDWALQDIHALSHEISEWGDDPFVNNWVEPWLTPTAPQYGCTNVLETGDPVVGIGFTVGSNSTDQTQNPNGTVSYDGSYHPEDEVFLPWFMRTSPNTVSEGGRYTLMGNLNPFSGFQTVATGC
jgi:hypothetical protein